MARYSNPARDREPRVLVPFTAREAQLAVEALRHVGREVFDGRPEEDVLCDASTAVSEALAAARIHP
jgi:hypothetical protein